MSTATPPVMLLVNMPYGILERPSLALGSLQGALRRAGIECQSLYPNLEFAKLVGLGPYRTIEMSDSMDLLGEWTFSPAVFGEFPHDREAYQRSINFSPFRTAGFEPKTLWGILQAMRDRAGPFVEKIARRVVDSGARIVGASSTFQQHCASLALLKRVRELDPSIVTMMGGANCEGPMGLALRRNFPWVDYVFSGEADLAIVDLVRAVTEGAPLPEGAMGADLPATAPRANVKTLDEMATPDYASYFQALADTGMFRQVIPSLPIETSRGCWWGARHHCTFCGLNGSGMGFRVKHADRALEEFDELAERYRVKNFLVVDNILAMESFKNLLPRLEGRGYRMFLETKANLKRSHVEALAGAGAVWFLPGLESLQDDVLKLMDKGTTGLTNLQTLKWARELGLRVAWAILCQFPGEKDEWYQEMAAWMPSLHHLQPPAWVNPIAYHRFSPYHVRAAEFGIVNQPSPAYPMVYPLPEAELRDLAYFFVDAPGSARTLDEGPGLTLVRERAREWAFAFEGGATLAQLDDGTLLDTRHCAVQREHRLEQPDLYAACDTAQTVASLERQGFTGVAQRLALRQGDRYLALATHGKPPRLPAPHEFPGGSTGVHLRPGPRPWMEHITSQT